MTESTTQSAGTGDEILYVSVKDDRDDRIRELEDALREARPLLHLVPHNYVVDHPDRRCKRCDARGVLARIDALLGQGETP